MSGSIEDKISTEYPFTGLGTFPDMYSIKLILDAKSYALLYTKKHSPPIMPKGSEWNIKNEITGSYFEN